MEHYSTTFFCEKGKQPKVSINSGNCWAYCINLNSPSIQIHIKDLDDLTSFKQSLDESFNKVINQDLSTLEPIPSKPDSSELVEPKDDLGDLV